jgi:hypothetical protein
MEKTSYIRWDDNVVRIVLEQHALLDFTSASSPTQQYSGSPVDSLRHISLIPSHYTLYFLVNVVCLEESQHIPILCSLVWIDWSSYPRSTTLEASTLTTTPPMRFLRHEYWIEQHWFNKKQGVNTGSMDERAVQASHVAVDVWIRLFPVSKMWRGSKKP